MLYRCDSCGASMVYDPERKALVCPQCSREQTTMPDTGTASVRMECPNCGAGFENAERRLVYQCPYCSSWMSMDQNLAAPGAPKKITPFTFGKKTAREKIMDAFDRIPFLPDSFLKDPDGNDIEAIYAPFWIYKVDAIGDYSYRGEKQTTTRRGRTVTTFHSVYDIHRGVRAAYGPVMIDAMDALEDKTIDAALPYNPNQSKDMDPIYLSGTSSYLPDKEADDEEYVERARSWVHESMEEREERLVHGYAGLHSTGNREAIDTNCASSESVLLPVYRYLYKGTGQHKIYMNGTSGRMSGDAPCDKGKVLIHYLIEAACTIVSAAALVGILGVLL